MNTVLVDGVSIAYIDLGPRNLRAVKSLFLVHGNSSSKKTYEKQLNSSLSSQFRLVAIDLPGHGDSARLSRESPGYSIGFFGQVIAETAKALQLESSVFVGHSLGGNLLLEASALLPQARGFVIFGSAPLASPPNIEKAFLPFPATAAYFKGQITDDEIAACARGCFAPGFSIPVHFSSDMRNTDPRAREGIAKSLGALEYHDEVRAAENLRAPIALIQTEHEPFINPDYLEGLRLPTLWRQKIQPFAGAGHSPHWERPNEFNAMLTDFAHNSG